MDPIPVRPPAPLEAARFADRAAVETLFESYRNLLHLLADTSIPDALRGKVDASDLVQDTLLKAHLRFGQFRGASESEWVGWLKRILARSLIDLHRRYFDNEGRAVGRERSLERTLDRSSEALRRLVPASSTSPSGRATRREREVALADGLAQLPPKDREVVVLRSLRELSWAAVAELTGSSLDAARVRWARALRQLGRLMEDGA
jgi:RNA polymerase sigma-70 factor (ECF subfamily)